MRRARGVTSRAFDMTDGESLIVRPGAAGAVVAARVKIASWASLGQ